MLRVQGIILEEAWTKRDEEAEKNRLPSLASDMSGEAPDMFGEAADRTSYMCCIVPKKDY